MKTQARITLALEVSQRYYMLDQNQSQIATELAISRASVSRLLKFAREQGLVTIEIHNPLTAVETLANRIKEQYHLKDVVVVPTKRADENPVQAVGKAGAKYLQSHVKDHDIIGIGWGKTVYEVARQLTPQDFTDVQVVQMKGSAADNATNNFAYEAINDFAKAYQTNPQYLPLPVIFDQATTKQVIEQDRHISRTLDLGRQANVALFTVGTVRSSAMLFKLGYLTAAEQHRLQANSVGDAFSRFIDAEGQIADEQINQRTIGIELDALKQKETSILVVGKVAKVPATKAVLTAGYANVLIIDQLSAENLIRS
ncbi:sugar-binding transcriptional regulator [Limosilactobacillus equigenerosi]|uniref:DeoR family transcriptional regulator n=1 Tax=Limosilactobacillus equigenerosi DSM 18793 = JCM 14505 TaxID=1423742 RepID=A0A0R1UT06_9LACO|nr:sugar-binding transcriptional regulator [Limosilactobacillus equigenerosi]KRL96317.1 DeoR family transcriptional regulator [Limosilactobacillus equigenerosi DSM 18793 = JCM 14505]